MADTGEGVGREQEKSWRKKPLEIRRLSLEHLLSGIWTAMAKGLLSWGPHLSLQTHLLLTLSGFQSHLMVILSIPTRMLPRFPPLAVLSPWHSSILSPYKANPYTTQFPQTLTNESSESKKREGNCDWVPNRC